jgi:uncharacterized protein
MRQCLRSGVIERILQISSENSRERVEISGLDCWIVTDGKPGMENQCRGLAEWLGCRAKIKRIQARAPWRWLPPWLWVNPLAGIDPTGDDLAPPWPDLLIATGRLTAAPAAEIRRLAAGRTIAVQIQNPTMDPGRFDLVVVPAHDRLQGPTVVETLGALHRVTPGRLAEAARQFAPALAFLPRPLVAVLVGGSNVRYRLTAKAALGLGERLASLARREGAGIAVTGSRRTGAANLAALRQGLGQAPAIVWDGVGDNPYFGYLALADAIVVTADSVAMVSEALATGKPVLVADLPGGSEKFHRFHARLREAGLTQTFAGELATWSYAPPDDMARVAARVCELLAARRVEEAAIRRAGVG